MPNTPDTINAIIRDPNDPRYPTQITVYCDRYGCDTSTTGDYMVSRDMTSEQRLAVARRHLVANEGWSHTTDGDDFCPEHASAPAGEQQPAEVGGGRAMSDPFYAADGVTLHLGDSLGILPTLPDVSVDAIVTDPPYEIGVAGQGWDRSGIAYSVALWVQCLRVLKPGGHLLSFGAPRTYHRMACAVEDAGFEIRDSLHWIYGTGFPKSMNVSKATKMENWRGWGTALKPAHEPILLARRPLGGTVAANVVTHGTGALNIDACRVDWDAESLAKDRARRAQPRHDMTGGRLLGGESGGYRGDAASPSGRWPTNVLLGHGPACVDGGDCQPGCPVAEIDRQTRGASRFFPVLRYEPKAPSSERPRLADGTAHTTVKPLALMRWLVRLVAPPGGGNVLDPFAGSGTTLAAALREDRRAVGIELNESYARLAVQRLSTPYAVGLFDGVA